MAGDLYRFFNSVCVLAFRLLALPAKVPLEQCGVVSLEQDAHRRAVAEISIETNEGDVIHNGRAHHTGDFCFADRDLLLESLADVAIDAFDDEHIAKIALPMAHEVAKP